MTPFRKAEPLWRRWLLNSYSALVWCVPQHLVGILLVQRYSYRLVLIQTVAGLFHPPPNTYDLLRGRPRETRNKAATADIPFGVYQVTIPPLPELMECAMLLQTVSILE